MIQVVCGWKFHPDTVKMWQMELYWRPPDLEMDLRNISLRKLQKLGWMTKSNL